MGTEGGWGVENKMIGTVYYYSTTVYVCIVGFELDLKALQMTAAYRTNSSFKFNCLLSFPTFNTLSLSLSFLPKSFLNISTTAFFLFFSLNSSHRSGFCLFLSTFTIRLLSIEMF